jgi:serine/threonine protein kinase
MEKIDIKPFEIKKVQKIVESKETQALVECLESLEIHAETIGEGGNAEVLAIAEGPFSKVCLKRIRETPQIICNDIDRENELQGKARRAGVRTPLALISFETEDEKKYFIMEKIVGNNIEEIIGTPSKLPESFSYEIFIKDLEDQIKKLHNAGIYHRDLHIRNVMINEEGLPVIIDFGTATEGTGSDNTYEEYASKFNPVTGRYEQVEGIFNDDIKMFRNLKSALAPVVLQVALTRNN